MRPIDRLRRWWFPIAFVFIIGGTVLWRSAQPYPIYDVYPIYFGARAWLETGSAYDIDAAVNPLDLYSSVNADGVRVTPYEQMHRYGNAYPFPAVAWLLPLTLLPPKVFSTVWLAGLVGGLLLALRWARAPIWLAGYLAVWQGLRLEQFAVAVLIAQIIGLHAYQRRNGDRWGPFVVAVCCAVMLLKPTQGAVMALALLAASRCWRRPLATLLAFGLVWGLPTVLDPNWIGEWLAASKAYRAVSLQYIPWMLLPAAAPLLWAGDWASAAAAVQFALSPYTWLYSAMSLPLDLSRDRRFPLLVIASQPAAIVAALLIDPLSKAQAEVAAIALTMLLPAVALSLIRRRERQQPATRLGPAPAGD